jgi:hypothetical protein
MGTDLVSKTRSFVFIEYQTMGKVEKPRNPENYKLVLSLFVKLGTIIKIAVCYTAKNQSHTIVCMFLGLRLFPFHPAYVWLLPVKNGGRCTLFHKLIKHKHMLVTSEASICLFRLIIHKFRDR